MRVVFAGCAANALRLWYCYIKPAKSAFLFVSFQIAENIAQTWDVRNTCKLCGQCSVVLLLWLGAGSDHGIAAMA
jgi:hypothetical protein